MSGIAAARLAEERKTWRKNHPFGFIAKIEKNADGTLNLFRWVCGVPGKKGTPWEGGLYRVLLAFDDEYPASGPKCKFDPPIFHPNVFASGLICLSLFNEEGWKASTTISEILIGIQELLDTPNINDPASAAPSELLTRNPDGYKERIRAEAIRCEREKMLKEYFE